MQQKLIFCMRSKTGCCAAAPSYAFSKKKRFWSLRLKKKCISLRERDASLDKNKGQRSVPQLFKSKDWRDASLLAFFFFFV